MRYQWTELDEPVDASLVGLLSPRFLGAEEELADDRHAKEGFGLLAAAGLEVQLVVQDSDRDVGVE
jgi:hypothetical protein